MRLPGTTRTDTLCPYPTLFRTSASGPCGSEIVSSAILIGLKLRSGSTATRNHSIGCNAHRLRSGKAGKGGPHALYQRDAAFRRAAGLTLIHPVVAQIGRAHV